MLTARIWNRLSLGALILTCLAGELVAQDYDLELMVQTGGGFSSLDFRVGVNDAGMVAFTGDDGSGSKAYVSPQPGQVTAVSFSSSGRVYGGASVNNQSLPQVVSRDRVSGSPAFTFIRKWPSDGSINPVLVGKSPTDYDSGLLFVDLNDGGTVAFSGLIGGSTQTGLFAGSARPPTLLAVYSGIVPLHPQISNTNRVVVRDNLQRIIVWPFPAGAPEIIASSITGGFSATGSDPGISPDGTVIALAGDRGAGEGVFASVAFSGGRQLIRVAGEGLDGLTNVDDNQRVGVTAIGGVGSGQRITVVFGGTLNGASGVYSAEFVATEVGGVLQTSDEVIRPVALVGDLISGKTISSYWLNDPISGAGWIALRAGFTDGTAGVIRAARLNFVRMGAAAVPMRGVEIELALRGTSNWQSHATTGSNGGYLLANVVAGSYHVRAALQYTDPATGRMEQIVNYPNWDPGAVITVSADQPIDVPDIFFPEPTILQGGLFGGTSTWSALVDYFTEDPATSVGPYPTADKAVNRIPGLLCFPMPESGEHAAGYKNSGFTVDDHVPNARLCADWVTNQVEPLLIANWIDPADLGQLSYFLVAHSMGNLIARAMVTSGFSPPILRIVSMDGVHGGSRWANVLPFKGIAEPPVNGIASNAGDPPIFVQTAWNAPFVDLDNDPPWLLYSCRSPFGVFGIVNPDESAWGLGRVYRYDLFGALVPSGAVMEWVFGGRVMVNDSHSSIHNNPIRLMETALFLLRGALPASEPARLGSGGDPSEGLGGFSASLNAAPLSLATQVMEFDTNSSVYLRAALSGSGASYLLRAPGGAVMTPIDFQTESFGEGVAFDWQEFAAPPSGSVTVELTAGAAQAATLELAVLFGNGRSLITDAAPVTLPAGAPVQLLAHLDDGSGLVLVGTSPAFSAAVTLPDGSVQPVTLWDDGLHGDSAAGDGIFGESFGATALAGRYGVLSRGRSTLGGETVERNQDSFFAVLPAVASFTGTPVESTPDVDADGLFDSLTLSQTVSFSANGAFKITGTLLDSTGQVISGLSATFENVAGPGSAVIEFVVPGAAIVIHGVDGPWTVSGLTLYDLDAGSLPGDTLSDHVTQAYPVALFEPPPPPTITWILPNTGSALGGGEVVISGTGLGTSTEVLFGSLPASFSVVDDETLRVTVPGIGPTRTVPVRWGLPGVPVPNVVVDLTVSTPWGTAVLSQGYTYRSGA